ncbi:SpoIIE family protein phosphatase [Phaeacidiphilus oryzae]|uniref:SpoIIE family protein phosphatase n=1 Tax=Phaeacidiphilus oryzae TaxID=348818 RepID=UPI0006917E4D|nr:SpoIIE family protein phosphatase [Phaeacidiphilus oryzae]
MPGDWGGGSAATLTGSRTAPAAFLRRAQDGPAPAGLPRPAIRDSWARCHGLELDPGRHEPPYRGLTDLDPEDHLLRAAAPVVDRLHTRLAGARVGIVLTDETARVRLRLAGCAGLNRHLDAVRLAPGFSYAEDHAGTNGIGTALTERRPFAVLSTEHFVERLRDFACAGAPVRDPLSGEILGILDLTCWNSDRHPMMPKIVGGAVLEIEGRLLAQYSAREQALLAAVLTTPRVSLDDCSALSLGDRATLRDAAAELISLGRAGLRQVTLSGGRTAALHCRRARTPGAAGAVETLVVEAHFPFAGWETDPKPRPRLTPRPRPSAPERTRPGGPEEEPAAGPGPRPGSPAPDGDAADRLPVPAAAVLIGDATAARLAVAARRRLALLCQAGSRIGTTLEVDRTAQELAEIATPGPAEECTVDLWDWVLDGGEPPAPEGPAPIEEAPVLRRAAACPRRRARAGVEVGAQRPALPPAPFPDQPAVRPAPDGGSCVEVPIRARGTVLGLASFRRGPERGPFQEDDVALLGELVGRAAVALDNARRYTRESTLALTLQQSLLPGSLPDLRAAELAHGYQPASDRGGVGGDWYDALPLSGGRIALVVGEVAGHGLHAAATMGRLRTAIRNFSTLDLPPDELIGQLDALADPSESAEAGIAPATGATCLYVVHDPVTGQCTMASAGHRAPALLYPDGTAVLPRLPTGPPLGNGGSPYESVDLTLPEGTTLVLYTDGLTAGSATTADGEEALREALASLAGRPPAAVRDELQRRLRPARALDDAALLVARTRRTDADHLAVWDVPMDAAAVGGIRAEAARRLHDWGLDELVFTTELMVSELVTNAIRYTAGPVRLRLLRDRTLICEVTDGSATSPRLRRARSTDEGGRGLFLVAQLAHRWGTRYTHTGKVIWAEQPLPSASG